MTRVMEKGSFGDKCHGKGVFRFVIEKGSFGDKSHGKRGLSVTRVMENGVFR